MEKQEIFQIHGKQIIVNLTYAKRTAHRFSFNGGQINMTVNPRFSHKLIESSIEKAIPKSKIDLFISEPYVGQDYIDITGIRHRLVVLEEGMSREHMTDYVIKRRDNIRKEMRKLAYDIYLHEIQKWEPIMNIDRPHTLKVTNMSAAVGKHYKEKNMITLDEDLIHYSIEIIDSVVIHELCHYFYQDHSKNFYDLLLKYCPNYYELKRKLTYGERR